MSNGKLKAQYNRVRTSVSLNANSMWTKTIGLAQDPQAGSNAAVEASLRAPVHGVGAGARVARREAAQELINKAGVQQTVTDFNGLVALAKKQTGGGGSRGACKICGGLGHLTKQCRNFLSTAPSSAPSRPDAAAVLALLGAEDDELSDLSSSDLDSSSSDSSSSSGEERKRKRKHKKSKKASKESKKSKKSKDSKKSSKHKKHKKHSKADE